MTTIQLNGYSVYIDIENARRLVERIRQKLQKSEPLDELERAFRQAQIDEDREEKEEMYRR